MKIELNTAGINPTAQFIEDIHTGKFVEIIPGTFIIKGAKNDRGFEQGYAISNNRKELILIDVVDAATKDAVTTVIKDGYTVKAIFITSASVLQDAYNDLETLSQDAGGAMIYMHPDIESNDTFEIKSLTERDSLLSEFNMQVDAVPANKKGAVLIYSEKNNGILFAGDTAKGSPYDTDAFTFTREKAEKKEDEFELAKFWQNYGRDFTWFLPRKGKPAIEVDNRTRSNILSWLSRGGS